MSSAQIHADMMEGLAKQLMPSLPEVAGLREERGMGLEEAKRAVRKRLRIQMTRSAWNFQSLQTVLLDILENGL